MIHVGRIGRPDPISLAEARFRRLSELSIRPALDRCVAGIVSFIHAMADRLIRCTALDVCTFTQLVIRGQARTVHFYDDMSLVEVTEQSQKAKRQKLKRTRDGHVQHWSLLGCGSRQLVPSRSMAHRILSSLRASATIAMLLRDATPRLTRARMPSPSRCADRPSMALDQHAAQEAWTAPGDCRHA